MNRLTRRIASVPPRLLWAATIGVVAGVHASTLTISPTIAGDETQIIDYGRALLEPSSDWALTWDVDRQQPLLRLAYLGTLGQELGFRAAGGSLAGPRLVALLGALWGASCCYAWLLSLGVSRAASWALALTWLLDPLIAQNYRHARVDVWAQAWCFATCFLLSTSAARGSLRHVAAAGATAVAMMLTWTSGVLLLPILLWAALDAFVRLRKRQGRAPDSVKLLGALFLGVVGGVAVAMAPFWELLPRMWDGSLKLIAHNVSARDWGPDERAAKLLWTLRRSPLLPLATCVALVVTRDRLARLTVLVAVAAVLLTKPYIHRAVYLAPFFVLGVAAAGFRSRVGLASGARLLRVLLVAAVCWSVLVSLVARPVVAFLEREQRNAQRTLQSAASSPIRSGDSVWMANWQLYYAGRAHGWRMYGPALFGESARKKELCRAVDFAVLRRRRSQRPPEDCGLSNRGLLRELSTVALLPKLAEGYGPYELWARAPLGN